MKATLEFNLPDDQFEFDDAVNGSKWKLFAWEFDQWLRSQTKYAPDSQSGEYTNALYVAREKFHEMLNESTLKLD